MSLPESRQRHLRTLRAIHQRLSQAEWETDNGDRPAALARIMETLQLLWELQATIETDPLDDWIPETIPF